MSYKYREEIVGKRFLSVSGGLSKLKLNKISEWGWRAGVIRASSHRDNKHPELQVLAEYDDVEWQRREWLSLHKGRVFHAFLVEHSLVWAPKSSSKLWPALTFSPLVDNAQLSDAPSQPIEFLGDLELAFHSDIKDFKPFQNWENAPAGAIGDSDATVRSAVHRWSEFQHGQRIFLSTPSVLVGYRVEVYRAEGTTQWYTAVIVAYNEASNDLTVTDDTVLEEHNEDPRLVQMRLIGDGVVESIMRGENVGITPRRSRSASAAAAANLALPPPCRSPRVTAAPAPSPGLRGGNHTPPAASSNTPTATPTPATRPHRTSARTPETEKDRSGPNNGANPASTRIGTRRRKASGCAPPTPAQVPPRVITPPKPAPVIVEKVVDKLVVESAPAAAAVPATPPPPVAKSPSPPPPPPPAVQSDEKTTKKEVVEEEEEVIEVARIQNTEVSLSKDKHVSVCSPNNSANNKPPTPQSLQQQTSRLDNVATMLHHPHQLSSAVQQEHQSSRLLDAASPLVSGTSHPASSSDSGVGSLRSSSSSDERSASASSSSRSSEPGISVPTGPPPSSSSTSSAAAVAASSNNLGAPSEPVRVWRDPSLVQASEPLVRHIHSVQHLSLMPQHHAQQPGAPPSAPERTAPPTQRGTPSPYPPPPPPMLHLLAPPLYAQLQPELWKQQQQQQARYIQQQQQQQQSGGQSQTGSSAAEEMLERERALAQDRDRQERYHRERREHEARERAVHQHQQQAAAERDRHAVLEAEREKQRAEQAVHKHFEESLRLAQHKFPQRNLGPGWMLNTLPPPQSAVTSRSAAVAAAAEEEAAMIAAQRKAAVHAHREREAQHREAQQQRERLLLAEKQRQEARDRAYYAGAPPPQPSPAQVMSRKDYPPKDYPLPPAAHSRVQSKHPHPSASPLPPQAEPKLAKMEPGYNAYGYPAYQPMGLLATTDKMCKELNPPQHIAEHKSSVIVKNESKSPAPPSKMYAHYPQRAPTPQNLASKRHLPPTPESRAAIYPSGAPFATAGKGSAIAFPYTTTPPSNNPAMYPHPSAQLKPKVSSPAPPQIFGKPTAGLLAPSISHHLPREVPSPLPLTKSPYMPPGPPPPAHTGSRHTDHARALEHQRLYVQGPPAPPSPAPGATPSARQSPLHIIPTRPSPSLCQTQPLDLGLCSRESNSPKRSAPSPDMMRKRRPVETPIPPQQMSPQLSRVGEPSPLIASAATTITTVENVAVSGSVIQRPAPPLPPVVNTTPPVPQPISPPPKQTPSYQGHKLKKAWLQRHSGEDLTTEQRCVTPVTPSPSPAPGSPANREPAAPVPSSSPQPATPSKKLNTPKALASIRKATASIPSPIINGHADSPGRGDSDSSSTDEKAAPAQRKTPVKRKPKVKRRKGAKKTNATEDKRRKVASESVSESDKESGTEKDSEDSVGSAGGKKAAAGKETTSGSTGANSSGNAQGNGGKKRGRRPKSKNDEPRPPKKSRGGNDGDGSPTPPPRDPVKKPPISQLKKSGESFLQDGYCFEIAPKLAKCRECRLTQNQRNKNMLNNIFCRFYYFRRLRYTKNGQLATAGFSDPYTDASEEDVRLWMPDIVPADLEPEMAKFLLSQVGDQFCDLIHQETEAIEVNMAKDKKIVWKRVVQKVREMCDVCETTLFNFHWACDKCGFVVCIDCYKSRKHGSNKVWGEPGKDRDDFSWLLCTNRQGHEQERLMLTQIIAGDALAALGRRMHEARSMWNILQACGCPASKEPSRANGICKDLVHSRAELNGCVSGGRKNGSAGKESTSDGMSTLSWLADVALSNEDKKPGEESESDSDDSKEGGNYSTLRELLIRPSHKPSSTASGARSGSASPSSTTPTPANPTSANSKAPSPASSPPKPPEKDEDLKPEDKTEDTTENKPSPTPVAETEDGERNKFLSEFKHFIRRKNYRIAPKPLPARVMTSVVSKDQYPDIPHQWYCDGKLLMLLDPACSNNYRMFQDQWKRGQPVLVRNVASRLQTDLWVPERFAKDFGDEKADLINCMSGHIVPNTAIKHFWEGFESFSKRLKDKQGNAMLLKLKDWPPGEDFSDIMPAHMTDLMNALPLGEYTQRTGRLNIASRLPECFVRPDLGPKMYNAYGSALQPDKGTTNLHLDISDAVNVMVYSGCCKDVDNEENMKAALQAIDEANCDALTKRRAREKGIIPGALWHIYNPKDADCIRDLLNCISMERGERLEPHHDPIHDQSFYLDGPIRERLYKDYGVEGYAIVQCLGDAIFVPAGAPHQVRNLHDCIKVAEDFVSPENVSHCFNLTQEFRDLSDTHTNHEDKLQIKNIIYHAVKDSLAVLATAASSMPSEPEVKVKQEIKQDKVDNGEVSAASTEPSGDKSPKPQQEASSTEENNKSSSSSDNTPSTSEVKKDNPSSPAVSSS